MFGQDTILIWQYRGIPEGGGIDSRTNPFIDIAENDHNLKSTLNESIDKQSVSLAVHTLRNTIPDGCGGRTRCPSATKLDTNIRLFSI